MQDARRALSCPGTFFDATFRNWRRRRPKLTAPLSHLRVIGSNIYTAHLTCHSRPKVAPGAGWICPVLNLQRDAELGGRRRGRSARPRGVRGKGRGEGGE